MNDTQYNAMSRAAYAVRKLKDGKLTALTPQDLETVKQLLKDKDGYIEQAVAHNRTALQAKQDVDRCEWAVKKSAPVDACGHGVGPFEEACRECAKLSPF